MGPVVANVLNSYTYYHNHYAAIILLLALLLLQLLQLFLKLSWPVLFHVLFAPNSIRVITTIATVSRSIFLYYYPDCYYSINDNYQFCCYRGKLRSRGGRLKQQALIQNPASSASSPSLSPGRQSLGTRGLRVFDGIGWASWAKNAWIKEHVRVFVRVRVRVRVHVYISLSLYIYIYICIYLLIYVHMCKHICLSRYIRLHTHMCTCTHACVYISLSSSSCKYLHMHMRQSLSLYICVFEKCLVWQVLYLEARVLVTCVRQDPRDMLTND